MFLCAALPDESDLLAVHNFCPECTPLFQDGFLLRDGGVLRSHLYRE